MFTLKVRLLLGAAALLAIVFSLFYQNYPSTILYIACIAVLVVGYYRNGTVWLALQQLRRQKYDKANAYLSEIKQPERLAKSQKGYYYFIKAFVAMSKDDIHAAETLFNQALEFGVRTQNNEALVYLHLADIKVVHKDKAAAEAYLQKLQALKYRANLQSFINEVNEGVAEL
ncbi:hypothetical protein [uncultured Microscilla sp.]|uniref:hypothetical protein n=1 Tax=uncultured Microscilla sp. TaxID=432653 RepID=UPI00261E571A|nr:hypothetical protein [uncultured Microscilla sp.]